MAEKMSGGDRLVLIVDALAAQLRHSPRAARVVAFIIDYLFAGIVSFVPAMLAYRFLVGPETLTGLADFLDAGVSVTIVVAVAVCSLALSYLYYVVLPCRAWPGQTPGKRLTHLEVVMLDGSRAGLRVLTVRWLVMTFVELVLTMPAAYVIELLEAAVPTVASVYSTAGMVVSVLSAFFAWRSREHRALHDLAAGTWVYQDRG